MISDFSYLTVRLFGGFWRFRSRMRSQPKGSAALKVMRTIYFAYLNRYGGFIGPTTGFADEPCFPHNLHGVFVAGNAKIGRNCVIFHHVTIGANAIPDSKGVGCPTIGDNVYIGAGAKIIGGITIGDNCRIGANCVVTTNIPANTIVVLSSPRLIQRDGMLDNRYYRWGPNGPQYFDSGKWVQVMDDAIAERLKESF